jgi:hypothetical protein
MLYPDFNSCIILQSKVRIFLLHHKEGISMIYGHQKLKWKFDFCIKKGVMEVKKGVVMIKKGKYFLKESSDLQDILNLSNLFS